MNRVMTIPSDPRRSRKRQEMSDLTCEIGQVLDISGGGMRIKCGFKPPIALGQVTAVTVKLAGKSIKVQAQARWKRRDGLLAHQMGFKFVQMQTGLDDAIQSLIEYGFVPDAPKDKKPKKKRMGVAVDLPDYFSILGLGREADGDEIRQAFRDLAKKWHPDTNSSPQATEKFEKIQQAYSVLKDPAQRDALTKMLSSQEAA